MSKLLIADDSRFMRAILKNILSQSDFTDILEAGDGQQALDIYQKTKPDLVLLDIVMPKLDGLAALPRLVELGAKVVMVTAVGQDQLIKQAYELGAKDFILKPFNAKQVTQVVKQQLGEPHE